MEDSHQIISFSIASDYTMALDKEIQINLSLTLEEAYYNCTFSGHTVVTKSSFSYFIYFYPLIKKITTFSNLHRRHFRTGILMNWHS